MTTKQQNTGFGLVASLVILIVSIWYKIDLCLFAVLALLVSLLLPVLYTPFAWLWFGLAKILEQVMSKVILFLIFFLVVTPVGLLRRILGKDSLHTDASNKQKNFFENQVHRYEAADFEKQF